MERLTATELVPGAVIFISLESDLPEKIRGSWIVSHDVVITAVNGMSVVCATGSPPEIYTVEVPLADILACTGKVYSRREQQALHMEGWANEVLLEYLQQSS